MARAKQPKNIVVNVGLLLDAIGAAGGMKRAATKWRVDQNRINMLLGNKIPRLDCLQRICLGANLKASELIVRAKTEETAVRAARPSDVTSVLNILLERSEETIRLLQQIADRLDDVMKAICKR